MKQIPVNAFRFCKISITLLIWIAFVFQNHLLLYIAFGVLFLSALLGIKNAPMIVIYSLTIEKLFPSRKIELHTTAMRFAHSLGTIFCGFCIFTVLYFSSIGWWYVLGFAILKTLAMLGFCPGEAMYSCYKNGSCSIFKK